MRRLALTMALAAVMTNPAHAEDMCEAMPASVEGLPSISARIDAVKGAGGVQIPSDPITVVLPGRAPVEFDAETASARVTRAALEPECMIEETELSQDAKALSFAPLDTIIGGIALPGSPYCLTGEVSRAKGTPYVAGNAFGAKVLVTPISAKRVGVYFGLGGKFLHLVDGQTGPAFQFQATMAEARSLRANAAIAVLLRVMPPYHIAGSRVFGAKMDSPTEGRIATQLLAGKALCLAIVDRATGKVFAKRAIKPTKSH